MTNKTEESSRPDGSLEPHPDGERQLPHGGLLPNDFPDRLERFKKATGLTWAGLAAKIGVDYKQMYRWRNGVEPSGGALHALYTYAAQLGRLDILMGDGFQMTFLRN